MAKLLDGYMGAYLLDTLQGKSKQNQPYTFY